MTVTHLILIQIRKKALIHKKIEMTFKYLLDYLCTDSPWPGIFMYHLLSCFSLKCGAVVLRLVLINLYSRIFVHICQRTVTPKSDATLKTCSAYSLVKVLNTICKTPKLKLSMLKPKYAAKKHKT